QPLVKLALQLGDVRRPQHERNERKGRSLEIETRARAGRRIGWHRGEVTERRKRAFYPSPPPMPKTGRACHRGAGRPGRRAAASEDVAGQVFAPGQRAEP